MTKAKASLEFTPPGPLADSMEAARAVDPILGVPMPPPPFSDAILLAMRSHGDQPNSVEMPLTGELTITIGIRYVYFRVGGRIVYACPVAAIDTSEVH